MKYICKNSNLIYFNVGNIYELEKTTIGAAGNYEIKYSCFINQDFRYIKDDILSNGICSIKGLYVFITEKELLENFNRVPNTIEIENSIIHTEVEKAVIKVKKANGTKRKN